MAETIELLRAFVSRGGQKCSWTGLRRRGSNEVRGRFPRAVSVELGGCGTDQPDPSNRRASGQHRSIPLPTRDRSCQSSCVCSCAVSRNKRSGSYRLKRLSSGATAVAPRRLMTCSTQGSAWPSTVTAAVHWSTKARSRAWEPERVRSSHGVATRDSQLATCNRPRYRTAGDQRLEAKFRGSLASLATNGLPPPPVVDCLMADRLDGHPRQSAAS